MGRELKRVALDFSWELNKVWEGYINPYSPKSCIFCGGNGYSSHAKKLQDMWYGYMPFRPEDRGSVPFKPEDEIIRNFAIRNVSNSPEYYGTGELAIYHEAMRLCALFNNKWSNHINDDDVAALIKHQRLLDLTHTYVDGKWKEKEPAYIPTAKEVNEWNIRSFGHDGINSHVCIKAECERLGLPQYCDNCRGEGYIWASEQEKQRSEEWKRIAPPEGEGYQIWETVSEGSPISPVFSTPEELAKYMDGRKWGADKGTSYETWLAFINNHDWAPSLVVQNGTVINGVDAMVNR